MRGAKAELASLKFQAGRRVVAPKPIDLKFRADLIKSLCEDYPRTEVPEFHQHGFFSREDVYAAIDSLNGSSSPGYPFAKIAKDKDQLVAEHREWLVDCVLERLRLYQVVNLWEVPEAEDPVWLVEHGFACPLRTFIKNDPHPPEKIRDMRLRLIMSGSVIQELCERVMCGRQNQAEIANWTTIPSKPGMGLGNDLQGELLFDYVDEYCDPEDLESSDVSGWDFCVTAEMLMADAERRIICSDADPAGLWARIVRNLAFVLARSVIVLSDGRAFAQTIAGIMKSGSYNTSSSNSFIRVFMARLVGAAWAFAMGDDCVEQKGDYIRSKRYFEYGIRVTGSRSGPDFEFCSHKFLHGSREVIPMNGSKSLFRLLSNVEITAELLVQFEHEYRHDPNLPFYKSVIETCYGAPSYTGGPPELVPEGPVPEEAAERVLALKRSRVG
jgi:hypothetical protein